MKTITAITVTALLSGCAWQPHEPVALEPGRHAVRELTIVLHADRESIVRARPRGWHDVPFQAFTQNGNTIHVVAPEGWGDKKTMCLLGHELLHVAGARHEGNQGC